MDASDVACCFWDEIWACKVKWDVRAPMKWCTRPLVKVIGGAGLVGVLLNFRKWKKC